MHFKHHIVCRVQKVWSYEENKFMVYVTEEMIIGIILLHIPLKVQHCLTFPDCFTEAFTVTTKEHT